MLNLLNHRVGDIVVLSSLGIMQDHNVLELECEIIEKRKYHEPSGLFTYTAFICKAPTSDIVYMLMIRQVGSDVDMILYYNEHGMDVREVAEHILTPDGQNLLDTYNTNVTDTKGEVHEIVWIKKSAGTFFGVEFEDGEIEGMKTICEYSTNSECGGNSNTFVDWSGNNTSGWIEFWVGCGITPIEAKIYTPANPL